MSSRALSGRFQGRETQFHIELLYGALFIAGFAYLAFRVDPRVAAFEGGLVVGYLLRIWEKMSIYERILQEAVSREAETQVEAEVEAQVDQVEERVDEQVEEQVDERLDRRVEEQVGRVEERVDDRIETEVEKQVDEQIEGSAGDDTE
jgi:cobalamin biosynthesis protein CbiD